MHFGYEVQFSTCIYSLPLNCPFHENDCNMPTYTCVSICVSSGNWSKWKKNENYVYDPIQSRHTALQYNTISCAAHHWQLWNIEQACRSLKVRYDTSTGANSGLSNVSFEGFVCVLRGAPWLNLPLGVWRIVPSAVVNVACRSNNIQAMVSVLSWTSK